MGEAGLLLSPRALESMRALNENKKNQRLWTWHSIRLQTALMLCLSMACNGLMRGSMSVAIVCMAGKILHSTDEPTNSTEPSADLNRSVDSFNREFQVDWSSEEQGNVHTAFYVGAFIAILATDWIIRKLDPRTILSFALLLSVIGSLLTPFTAIFLKAHLYVAFLRFVMGFGSGLIAPCGLFIISKWFPMTEKSTAVAIFTTGNQLGVALSMVLTAKLCQLSSGGGWPNAFVLYAFLTLLYVILWQWRGSSRPRASKYITATELEYITGRRGIKCRAKSVVLDTPWRQILSSKCVFAICVNAFAQSFVLTGLITYLPKFNQEALLMDVNTNGIWCSVPFFIQMATKMLFGLWADAAKKRGTPATRVTRTFNALATLGSGMCIVVAPLVGGMSPSLSMLSICLAMGLFGAFVPGYNTAIVCVAPQFTATISSYQQFYSQVGGFLAPFLIGILTTKGTFEEWRNVYILLAVILLIAGIFYQIWGHGNAEPWGRVDNSRLPSINDNEIDVRKDDGKYSSKILPNVNELINVHNNKLASEPAPPTKRVTRVSYRGYESNVPETINELENDVIAEETEVESKGNERLVVATRRRLISKDPDPEMVKLTEN